MRHHPSQGSIRLRGVLLHVLILVVCAIPVADAQPRVILRVENATLAEALQALERHTGTRFWLDSMPLSMRSESADAKRATFTWDGAPLGRVCRELGEAFGYRAERRGIGMVDFRASKEKPAIESPCRFTADGFTVSATQVVRSASVNVTLDLGAPQPRHNTSRAELLRLEVCPEASDPDVVHGIEGITVVTDAGPVTASVSQSHLPAMHGPVDDRWRTEVRLGPIPKGATRIVECTGRVVAYRVARWETLEVPLPLPQVPFERKVGPVTITITRADVEGARQLEYVTTWPRDVVVLSPRGHNHLYPVARLKSGGAIPLGGGGSGSDDKEMVRQTMRCGIGGVTNDPPVSLLFAFTHLSDPSLTVPFRLENIPLPEMAALDTGEK